MITGLQSARTQKTEFIVRDARMREVVEFASQVAQHRAAVLITGETGCGKELIARYICEHSLRCTKPWVDINCAALPEPLIESELFGYEKGAFSGADAAKPGLFETAEGGTLFLDEIGDLDPRLQVKLLRVLDGAPYYRLGGNKKVSVDVRIIAATNSNLEDAVAAGTFRADLYHRLGQVRIQIPPLRERPDDIPAMAEHFLAQSHPEAMFTADALNALRQYQWPGNARELRNLVLRLALLVRRKEISAEDVHNHMQGHDFPRLANSPLPDRRILTLEQMERIMIQRALDSTLGNQSHAAKQLGISRRTLSRKLNEYKILRDQPEQTRNLTTRRFEQNARAELNVDTAITTADGRTVNAKVRDVSIGGLGLKNFRPAFDIYGELTLKFSLPGSTDEIEAKGVLVWVERNGTAGIRFSTVTETTSNVLREWISKQRLGAG